MQVLRGCHRRTLFHPTADQSANFTVQLHLEHFCRQQRVQHREQGAVIGGFPAVHRLLLPGAMRLIIETGRKKNGRPHNSLCRFSF